MGKRILLTKYAWEHVFDLGNRGILAFSTVAIALAFVVAGYTLFVMGGEAFMEI